MEIAFYRQSQRSTDGLKFRQAEVSQFFFQPIYEAEEDKVVALRGALGYVPGPFPVGSEQLQMNDRLAAQLFLGIQRR